MSREAFDREWARRTADAEAVLAIETAEFIERWDKLLAPELAECLRTEVTQLLEVSMQAMGHKTIAQVSALMRGSDDDG
jgi:hypothetical protein